MARKNARAGRGSRPERGGWHPSATVFISGAVAVGLLAYVISVATGRGSAHQLEIVLHHTRLLILGLMVPYLALRALVWRELLLELGIVVPWRPMLIAFSVGEMTKDLPAGAYVENYLLGKLTHRGSSFMVRSSTATTATLALEALLALPAALVVGVPHAAWLFWALLGVAAAWIVVLTAVWAILHYWHVHLESRTPSWLTPILGAVEEFLRAGFRLVRLRTARLLVPTALYMLVYVIYLYAIIQTLGIHGIGFTASTAIYAVMALAGILDIVPSNLGVVDISGLAALRAYGIPPSPAAVVVLSLRILASGMNIVMAGVLLLIVHYGFTSRRPK